MSEEGEGAEIEIQDHVKEVDDFDYFAHTNVFIQADDDKFIVKAPVENFQVVNEDGNDDYKVVIGSSLFKQMFRKFFSPHDLENENFYHHIEIHKNNFKKEIREWIENSDRPACIKLEEEMDKNDAQKRNDPNRFRPDVEIVDEEVEKHVDDDLLEQAEQAKKEDEEFLKKFEEGEEDNE